MMPVIMGRCGLVTMTKVTGVLLTLLLTLKLMHSSVNTSNALQNPLATKLIRILKMHDVKLIHMYICLSFIGYYWFWFVLVEIMLVLIYIYK